MLKKYLKTEGYCNLKLGGLKQKGHVTYKATPQFRGPGVFGFLTDFVRRNAHIP